MVLHMNAFIIQIYQFSGKILERVCFCFCIPGLALEALQVPDLDLTRGLAPGE